MNNPKVGLIILDGWGIGDGTNSDAIATAKTPTMDMLQATYPTATLTTFGEAVGLPEGQMGNSEVGHLNIGAGRIVYQELTRINKSIRDKEFENLPALKKAMEHAKKKQVKLHFIGLVSEGGVHSSQAHLHALCDLAKAHDLDDVYIHAFTDGRDCDPKSGVDCIANLQSHLSQSAGILATITGRYYAMDRDNRWERIKVAYDALVHLKGDLKSNAVAAIQEQYDTDVTDEFLKPIILNENGAIENGDVVICFNFRTDRPREMTIALTQQTFPEHDMSPLSLEYFTMTNYDKSYKNVHPIFEKDLLQNTLGEIVSKMGRKQLRIAETEKYPHVTFFFNGGREKEFSGEKRIMVASPKVATYDLQPEMGAKEITQKLIQHLQTVGPDFFCLNFANPDMVGHTGVPEAVVIAVETVDACLGEILNVANENDYELVIIADHGNADLIMNADGSPNTAHTVNPVPVVLFTKTEGLQLHDGILADVAPTILERMRIAAPLEMNGKSLISK